MGQEKQVGFLFLKRVHKMILDLSKDANDPVSGSVNDRLFDMELQTTSGTIPHKNLSSPRGDVHCSGPVILR